MDDITQNRILDRLDKIDSQLGDLRVQMVTLANSRVEGERRLEWVEDELESMNKRMDALDRRLEAAALPGKAVRWVLGAMLAGAAALGALKGLGVRWDGPAAADSKSGTQE